MTMTSWRTAYASVIGTSHQESDLPCQDAGICCNVNDVLLATVSDGAGSALRAEVGSTLTVEHFIRSFSAVAPKDVTKSLVVDWLTILRNEIAAKATEEGLQLRDYACTVAAAIVGQDSAVFFQIGDGAIVVNDYEIVFWPQHGEYINQTNFLVQDNYQEVLQFVVFEQRVEKLALFTDGIERLVLDFISKTVHQPSLRPIFEWLATTELYQEEGPSDALIAYLSSEFINGRTDDDKTLIMATREPQGLQNATPTSS